MTDTFESMDDRPVKSESGPWTVTDFRAAPAVRDFVTADGEADMPIHVEWLDSVAAPNFEAMVDDNLMMLTAEQAEQLFEALRAALGKGPVTE